MTIKTIPLLNNPNHINKSLTHWTGRDKDDATAFAILCRILTSKELKFGENKTSFPLSKSTVHNTMICFTDTPIEHSLKHCERYNFFGISFNKAAMIEYGANPVLYMVDNRDVHQERMSEYTVVEKYDRLMTWFGSMLQPFNLPGEPNGSYFQEREWRIIRKLPFGYNVDYPQTENLYPFKGEIRSETNTNSSMGKTFFLKFDSSIIENIIVPPNYAKAAEEFIASQAYTCNLLIVEKPKAAILTE
jgi:hypothetical protein